MGDDPKKVIPPGWNDPPMLNYNPTNPPPKSRISNKRVAFPLTTTANQRATASEVPVCHPCNNDILLKTRNNFDQILLEVNDENIRGNIKELILVWEQGKFPVTIQETLHLMSHNLLEKNVAKAKELHLKLVMDNALSCSSHLSVLQQLINCFG